MQEKTLDEQKLEDEKLKEKEEIIKEEVNIQKDLEEKENFDDFQGKKLEDLNIIENDQNVLENQQEEVGSKK